MEVALYIIYGLNCKDKCSDNCLDGYFDKETGDCSCSYGEQNVKKIVQFVLQINVTK
jgi:hypothetical protein